MSKLSAADRKKIPAKDFAGPDRSYPINDESHARNALSRVSANGSSELKAQVRRKVHAKYPDIKMTHIPGGSYHEVVNMDYTVHSEDHTIGGH